MNLNVLEDIAFNVVTLFLYRAELVSGNGRFCGFVYGRYISDDFLSMSRDG